MGAGKKFREMYRLSKKMKGLGIPEENRREYLKNAFGFLSWPGRVQLNLDLNYIGREGLRGQEALECLRKLHMRYAEAEIQRDSYNPDFP